MCAVCGAIFDGDMESDRLQHEYYFYSVMNLMGGGWVGNFHSTSSRMAEDGST